MKKGQLLLNFSVTALMFTLLSCSSQPKVNTPTNQLEYQNPNNPVYPPASPPENTKDTVTVPVESPVQKIEPAQPTETVSEEPDNINDKLDNLPEIPVQDKITPDKNIKLSSLAEIVFQRINNPLFTDLKKSTVEKDFLLTDKNKLVKVLVDGEQIFNQYRHLIAMAKSEIVINTFFWETDSDPVRVIGEGIKIAEKNIEYGKKLTVRIIVNDFQLDSTVMQNVLHDTLKLWNINKDKVNIELATYPHFSLGSDHSKYLVVDQKYIVITGANNQKKMILMKKAWHDTGYYFEGALVKTVLNDFDQMWNQQAYHWDCQNRQFIPDCYRLGSRKIETRVFENTDESGNIPIIALTKHANGEPNNTIDNPMSQGWLAVMENAKSHIDIETPNINDDAFQNAVINAVKRGIKVNLITGKGFNGSREDALFQGGKNIEVIKKIRERISIESPLKQSNLMFKWYSHDGINPVEGNDANANHTKYMSIDDQITIIGSGNMDTQSWNHSREFNILLDSKEATADIKNSFFIHDWQNGIIVNY